MTYELRISPKADNDLEQIANWYLSESNSIDIANQWYTGFLAKLESLNEHPDSFAIAHESHRLPYEVRQLLYGSGRRKTHRALFRINDSIVEVLTIRHLSQVDITTEDII